MNEDLFDGMSSDLSSLLGLSSVSWDLLFDVRDTVGDSATDRDMLAILGHFNTFYYLAAVMFVLLVVVGVAARSKSRREKRRVGIIKPNKWLDE